MEHLFKKLQYNFDLNSKHLLILKSLVYESLDAGQICSKTSIPKGRIYDYLNFLLENKLIERTSKKPFLYSIPNMNRNIIGFMKHKIDRMIEAQTEVMNLMEGPGLEHFELIQNSKKFTHTHLNMISESKVFRYVSLHDSFPYILYPINYNDFIKLRKAVVENRPTITFFDPHIAMLIHKNYLDAFEKGKKMTAVFEKKSFDFHVKVIKKLGKDFFERWKKSMIEQFKRYKIKVYTLNEYIPTQIDINERRVSVSMRHMGVINGIAILGAEVTKFYNKVFEENCQRGKDVFPLIRKLKY